LQWKKISKFSYFLHTKSHFLKEICQFCNLPTLRTPPDIGISDVITDLRFVKFLAIIFGIKMYFGLNMWNWLFLFFACLMWNCPYILLSTSHTLYMIIISFIITLLAYATSDIWRRCTERHSKFNRTWFDSCKYQKQYCSSYSVIFTDHLTTFFFAV